MTREEMIAGLAGLNAPDQGMNYFGGGYRYTGRRFDERTGLELPQRYESAKLTVFGDRARFLYRLIENADALAADLAATIATAQPGTSGASEPSQSNRSGGEG